MGMGTFVAFFVGKHRSIIKKHRDEENYEKNGMCVINGLDDGVWVNSLEYSFSG